MLGEKFDGVVKAMNYSLIFPRSVVLFIKASRRCHWYSNVTGEQKRLKNGKNPKTRTILW